MRQRPYANPYLAGVALGLVLLAAFVLMGRGLGAAGGLTAVVAAGVEAVAPEHATGNGLFAAYLETPAGHPLADWPVLLVLGVFVGGFVSALTAGRLGWRISRGPGVSAPARLGLALAGGMLMGFAARLARGCTSGQALSGGAMLSVGAWLFMLAIFAGGYAFAAVVRRQWR